MNFIQESKWSSSVGTAATRDHRSKAARFTRQGPGDDRTKWLETWKWSSRPEAIAASFAMGEMMSGSRQ